MSIERRSEVIPAIGRIEVARGNFFLMLTSTGSVNIRLNRNGTSEGFNGVTGGVLVKRTTSWDDLFIEGAAGLTVTYFFGSEFADVDETDIRLQVATIAGVAAVAEQPSATLASSTNNVADASNLDIAANLLRKRITLCAPSTNTGSVFIRDQTGALALGIELQPGTFVEIRTTAALRVRNSSGAAQTVDVVEES